MAVGIHQVNQHLPAPDQVIVKADLFVFMGAEQSVREDLPPSTPGGLKSVRSAGLSLEVGEECSSLH